jgi:hypothetical protein
MADVSSCGTMCIEVASSVDFNSSPGRGVFVNVLLG